MTNFSDITWTDYPGGGTWQGPTHDLVFHEETWSWYLFDNKTNTYVRLEDGELIPEPDDSL